MDFLFYRKYFLTMILFIPTVLGAKDCDETELNNVVSMVSEQNSSVEDKSSWILDPIQSCRAALSACVQSVTRDSSLDSQSFQRIPFTYFSWLVVKNLTDPMAVLETIRRDYSGNAYLKLPFTSKSWIFTSDYAMAKQILVETDRDGAFAKSDVQSHGLQKYLGRDNIFLGKGKVWESKRKAFQSQFTSRHIDEHYVKPMESIIEEHIARIDYRISQSGHGKSLNLSRELTFMTLDIALRQILGYTTSFKSIENQISPAFETAISWLTTETALPIHSSIAKLPNILPNQKKYRDALKVLTALADAVIDNPNGQKSYFVETLLTYRDPVTNQQMTREEMRGEVLTILLAGHETTSTSLEWAIYDLLSNAKSRNQSMSEIQKFFAASKKIESYTKLKEGCPYLSRVMSESMRLHSPAYVVMREVTRDVTVLNGLGQEIVLGKNHQIVLNIHEMHKEESAYGKANTGYSASEFVPERFENGALKNGTVKTMPFGFGARQCLGTHFAQIESQMILAKLLNKFEFSLTETNIVRTSNISTRIKGGLQVAGRARF